MPITDINGTIIKKLSGFNSYNLKSDGGLFTDNGLITDLNKETLLLLIKKVKYYYYDDNGEEQTLILEPKSIVVDYIVNKMFIEIKEDFSIIKSLNFTDIGLFTDIYDTITDKDTKIKIPSPISHTIFKIEIINDNDSIKFVELNFDYMIYLPSGGELKLDIEMGL